MKYLTAYTPKEPEVGKNWAVIEGGGVSAYNNIQFSTVSRPVNFKARNIFNIGFQIFTDHYTETDVASGLFHVNQNSSELQSLEDLAFRADSGV